MSDFKFEAWPTEFRTITQQFGANPENYAQFHLPGHEGVDIRATHGSKIFAVAPGTVKMVQTDPNSKHAYGVHVRISHQDDYETIYAHFHQALVKVGDEVKAGDLIGLADNTGNSFGDHLHLTLKQKGAQLSGWPAGYLDPTPFLLPLMGWQTPAGPYTEGWAYTSAITIKGNLAQIGSGGINLRETPSVNGRLIDLVEEDTIVIVTGANRALYTPIKVPTVALVNGEPTPPPTPPAPTTPSTETVTGWGFTSNLTVRGNQATVGQFGINLRAEPRRGASNIGLVKGGTIVTITGASSGEYLPLQVRKSDFSGPINIPEAGTTPTTPPATPTVPSDSVLGWAWTQNLTIAGGEATSGRFGTNLRAAPNRTAASIGLFNEGAQAIVAGQAQGEYTPVQVRPSDITGLVRPLPTTTQPQPLPASTTLPPTPTPIHDTTPGWAFTAQITVAGGMATAGQFGINLRDAPRRNGNNIGFVPANASMIVTGAAQGEYTPVRVDDDVLQLPFSAAPVISPTSPNHSPTPPQNQPEPATLGQAKLGLHASADPTITAAEIEEFKVMRPGIIKLLSFHNPESVAKLAANHPSVSWIVRAFLDFGGRNISPQQFFNDTIGDTKRTLGFLQGKDVVIELHNEPNLVPEGMGSTWKDGAAFTQWWLQVLDLFRKELPGMRFIFPGLSPGASVRNLKMDHVEFIEACRDAVEAADGLGVHIYWSNVYPMATALGVLDDYISRFREEPIWVTEASNNKSGTSATRKGTEYITFWSELQKRPMVQGVTYFVASASNPQFAEEVWVGRGIAKIVGRR
ncbi:MAG: peptidoglycan DD-metalloendopeptidase family protein [Ardenticatenaceae bacterium]|nr:peptidoglycan DD-metalloendopeptidase family protein [Anaerolineales bacterium]MCB8922092.1 peptidoglycan DD-metalloendopeptidase family protein [Ardenticatenaceae bacterium]MCB9003208.1 peptidoglycan DD-metalloendopeptidase family protein [Ardenticatenaceae bacterium]